MRKRVLLIVLGVLAVAVAAVASLRVFLAPQLIARTVADAVRERTGRELEFNASPTLSFWPNLAVTLHDARLSNPPGMAEGSVAEMPRLRLRITPGGLLLRRVEVDEIVVEEARLNLLIDSQGRSNWSFASGRRPASYGATEALLSFLLDDTVLAPIRIARASLRYLDERTASRFAAEQVNLAVSFPRFDGEFQCRGTLLWNGEPVRLDFAAAAPMRLANGAASPVDLSIEARELSLAFSGRAQLREGLDLAGTLGLKTPSLRSLAAWAGAPLVAGRGLGPFEVEGSFGLARTTATFKQARIAIDGMRAEGDVAIAFAGPRPAVTGTLATDRLDLNRYLPAAAGGSAIADGWSDQPIDLSGLSALDADLAVAAAQLQFRKLASGRASLRLSIRDGALEARATEMALYEGTASGLLALASEAGTPVMRAALEVRGARGLPLLANLAGFERIDGAGELSLFLGASGRSQKELVASLEGRANLRFTDGAVRGVDLARMARNVKTGVLQGWEQTPERGSDFSVLEASFEIAEGLASSSNLRLAGPLLHVSGRAAVDLPAQALELQVDPKLVTGPPAQAGKEQLEGLPVPVILQGPWAAPTVYPAIEGMPQDPQAGYAALAKLIKAAAAADPIETSTIAPSRKAAEPGARQPFRPQPTVRGSAHPRPGLAGTLGQPQPAGGQPVQLAPTVSGGPQSLLPQPKTP